MQSMHVVKLTFYIVLSLLIGMVLQIIPLPHWAVWLWPEWIFIILLFWVLAQPHYIGLYVAFLVGLVVDLLMGTILAQHAVAFTVTIYLVTVFHPQLRLFPLWQQLLIIFLLILLQLLLQCWLLSMVGTFSMDWRYWLPALTSLFIWPLFHFLLRNSRTARGF